MGEAKKKKALSSRSKWLEGYSVLLSNGFERKVIKLWERDGLQFKTNKEALAYMKQKMGEVS